MREGSDPHPLKIAALLSIIAADLIIIVVFVIAFAHALYRSIMRQNRAHFTNSGQASGTIRTMLSSLSDSCGLVLAVLRLRFVPTDPSGFN